jgi:hypothetical protein
LEGALDWTDFGPRISALEVNDPLALGTQKFGELEFGERALR